MTHMKTLAETIAETGLNNNPYDCIQDLNLTTKVRGKCCHHRVISHSLTLHNGSHTPIPSAASVLNLNYYHQRVSKSFSFTACAQCTVSRIFTCSGGFCYVLHNVHVAHTHLLTSMKE